MIPSITPVIDPPPSRLIESLPSPALNLAFEPYGLLKTRGLSGQHHRLIFVIAIGIVTPAWKLVATSCRI